MIINSLIYLTVAVSVYLLIGIATKFYLYALRYIEINNLEEIEPTVSFFKDFIKKSQNLKTQILVFIILSLSISSYWNLKTQLYWNDLLWIFPTALLLSNAWLDYQEKILLNLNNLILSLYFIAFFVWNYFNHTLILALLLNHILAGFLGFVIIFFINFIYKKLRKQDGFGLGDAKLMIPLGFYLGGDKIIFNLILAVFLALMYTLPILVLKKTNLKTEIPFGPFLIAAFFLQIFFFNSIIF